MIQINYRDSRPIYEQIKDGIRKLIVQGIMQNNEKLPSVRELATSLTINPNRERIGSWKQKVMYIQ